MGYGFSLTGLGDAVRENGECQSLDRELETLSEASAALRDFGCISIPQDMEPGPQAGCNERWNVVDLVGRVIRHDAIA